MSLAKVYLIPSLLGEGDSSRAIPQYNLHILNSLHSFAVENEKSARKFIKTVLPEKNQSDLQLHLLNKHTTSEDVLPLLDLLDKGVSIGILSEAGLPAVADPGAQLVKLAHQKNIQVIPLVGPSSILLALMASGMNGQNFAFHGYLPIDKNERKKVLLQLEKESAQRKMAMIFMETPYRNNQMIEDVSKFCHPSTQFCVASNITLTDEVIITKSVKNWKNNKRDFHKKPTIFILEAE